MYIYIYIYILILFLRLTAHAAHPDANVASTVCSHHHQLPARIFFSLGFLKAYCTLSQLCSCTCPLCVLCPAFENNSVQEQGEALAFFRDCFSQSCSPLSPLSPITLITLVTLISHGTLCGAHVPLVFAGFRLYSRVSMYHLKCPQL